MSSIRPPLAVRLQSNSWRIGNQYIVLTTSSLVVTPTHLFMGTLQTDTMTSSKCFSKSDLAQARSVTLWQPHNVMLSSLNLSSSLSTTTSALILSPAAPTYLLKSP
jgi:hypothetical protein